MSLRVAVTGSGGQLGRQVLRAFDSKGTSTRGFGRPEFDLERPRSFDALRGWQPDLIVNAAAWTDVDGCARDPERANRVNGAAAGDLAQVAASLGAVIVQVSTNEVFAGDRHEPYTEADEPRPGNPYGASKRLGEQLVEAAGGPHLIVRTAWLFGPGGTNFVTKILAAAEKARTTSTPLRIVADEWGNPTSAVWLAAAIADAAEAAYSGDTASLGLWHLVGQPSTSRAEWARRILAGMGVAVVDIGLRDFPRPSRVPPRAVLASSRPGSPSDVWAAATDQLVADILAPDQERAPRTGAHR
jgi:dTDP-4-dehydrorhamnose reductase